MQMEMHVQHSRRSSNPLSLLLRFGLYPNSHDRGQQERSGDKHRAMVYLQDVRPLGSVIPVELAEEQDVSVYSEVNK